MVHKKQIGPESVTLHHLLRPWEFLYADDLVVIAETEDDLIKRLRASCSTRRLKLTLWLTSEIPKSAFSTSLLIG